MSNLNAFIDNVHKYWETVINKRAFSCSYSEKNVLMSSSVVAHSIIFLYNIYKLLQLCRLSPMNKKPKYKPSVRNAAKKPEWTKASSSKPERVNSWTIPNWRNTSSASQRRLVSKTRLANYNLKWSRLKFPETSLLQIYRKLTKNAELSRDPPHNRPPLMYWNVIPKPPVPKFPSLKQYDAVK